MLLESESPSARPIAEGGRPTAASRSRCAASGSFAAASGFDPSTIHRLFGSESSIFRTQVLCRGRAAPDRAAVSITLSARRRASSVSTFMLNADLP